MGTKPKFKWCEMKLWNICLMNSWLGEFYEKNFDGKQNVMKLRMCVENILWNTKQLNLNNLIIQICTIHN